MKGTRNSIKYFFLVLGLALLVVLVMDFNTRMSELRRLTREREAVAGRATQVLQTKTALETALAHATSEAAVSEWAYEDAHMIRPGDNPVVPLPGGGSLAPSPTPSPTPTPRPTSNWETWWQWLFGPR
jgi:hypothetical protein